MKNGQSWSADKSLHSSFLTFRSLRILSLVMGAGITDASVAAITSSFSKLELLDLSGYVSEFYFYSGFIIHSYITYNSIGRPSESHVPAYGFRSSISDSGIGMICNVLPPTLSKLLLALCPHVSSSNSYTPLHV